MEIKYGPAQNGSVGCHILLGGQPRLNTVGPFLDGEHAGDPVLYRL
jgi:hypothetical protein